MVSWLPTTRPRPANSNFRNFYPDLTVDALIDANSRTWNRAILQTLIDPEDVKLIESIQLSTRLTDDRDGWHFTKNGKYTVKSGYQVERAYPDKGIEIRIYGPSVDTLKAQCWKVRCPPKIKHFLWQIITGCIPVMKNLRSRGIQGDLYCPRCGTVEETVNHVFFECSPSVQVWALSMTPSNPSIFPTTSVFTNMDYLFWRINPGLDQHQFAWILWYIWKVRNSKSFSNLDIDPRDTLKVAEREALTWMEAQNTIERESPQTGQTLTTIPTISGRWCFVDGSWKEKDIYSGQGWYSTAENVDSLMGARNVRASLSPLHAEMEAFLWAIECMRNLHQYRVTFATDCSQLVKIVSEPEEWPAFESYIEDLKLLMENFLHAELIHIPRTANIRADSLARSVRKQPSFVVHMDSSLPAWFTESV